MRQARWVAAGVVMVAATAAVLAAVNPFQSTVKVAASPYPLSTAAVTRQSLTSQTDVAGTVATAGSYTLVNQASGDYTALPAAGKVVRQGQVLYQVSGSPVILLSGTVPSYRSLSIGTNGADVAELNHDLVALGDADVADVEEFGWDYFGWDTQYALELLQQHRGLSPTGTLALGEAVFAPAPVQVSGLADGVVLGGTATPGQSLLTASSTTPVVTVALDPGLQTDVKDGDAVSVTLPSGAVISGEVSSIGAATSSASPGSQGSSGSASGSALSGSSGAGSSPGSGTVTIPVEVTLSDPKAAAGLDQAPVSVTLTTGSVSDVLVVPVDALLAQPGGYAVEVTSPGRRRLVSVTTGLFDDAAGLVQVTGTGLAAGERVVVPGT